MITTTHIWQALEEVKDPELPLVSVVEMGIVRDVQLAAGSVHIKMTPTFSGCPALDVMQRDIAAKVRALGFTQVTVETVLHPPWTSDWIADSAREKLQQLGITPPIRHGGNLIPIAFLDVATCPRCGSTNTILKNTFGPTLCKSVWYCHECQDGFEQFKAL
ncbi:MAG: phenylacetate-CoA oxygenase subunit PaaJ [Chloroflexi bacterium]|nr:phenylacetate-CoA oxygenase subunit PaaJ [Ardenticatenaceae bacterium]MBL1129490.1 phenylacetate-CoA oxygenase subunit PaaJ [Chloroflexota bacterium]NOG35572.1 phenylacetate-CoA oxygenase subunit PaaJ [Chloroflexota bacterium]GIK58741.1 MAG: phenylacetate-CoA oxygenase subunit PaaJ [Chloroflexota bacterium]